MGIVHRQAVVGAVPGGKADDVMVRFQVLPLSFLLVAEVGPEADNGEVLSAVAEGGDAVVLVRDGPPVLIQDGPLRKFVVI